MPFLIHLGHELLARFLQLVKGRILRAQVRFGGHRVRFGDLHRVLHPSLGRRVSWFAGQDADPVVAGESHGIAVADRDAGDMHGGHGFLVVGQHIGRGTADQPERAVQRRANAGPLPVGQRDDHPEAGPGQPRDEQDGLHPVDHWPVAEIVLKP